MWVLKCNFHLQTTSKILMYRTVSQMIGQNTSELLIIAGQIKKFGLEPKKPGVWPILLYRKISVLLLHQGNAKVT